MHSYDPTDWWRPGLNPWPLVYKETSTGYVAQLVTCLAVDTLYVYDADSGVTSSIKAGLYTFVEIDHEIISNVILRPSADSWRVVNG